MPNLIWGLIVVFAPLSIVTIGGGQSAVADIHRQVVEVHHWLSQEQFLNDFAIARMAPGPGSILVTLIGWQIAGFWGAVTATLAIFGPTSFLIYGIAHLWRRYEGARWQRVLELGLRPVAAGMILAASFVLMQALDGGWVATTTAVVSTAILMLSRISPLYLIGAGALMFMSLRGLSLI